MPMGNQHVRQYVYCTNIQHTDVRTYYRLLHCGCIFFVFIVSCQNRVIFRGDVSYATIYIYQCVKSSRGFHVRYIRDSLCVCCFYLLCFCCSVFWDFPSKFQWFDQISSSFTHHLSMFILPLHLPNTSLPSSFCCIPQASLWCFGFTDACYASLLAATAVISSLPIDGITLSLSLFLSFIYPLTVCTSHALTFNSTYVQSRVEIFSFAKLFLYL